MRQKYTIVKNHEENELIIREFSELDKIGINRITFSESENKKYIDLAYQVEWDNLAQKVPDLIGDLKRVTGN